MVGMFPSTPGERQGWCALYQDRFPTVRALGGVITVVCCSKPIYSWLSIGTANSADSSCVSIAGIPPISPGREGSYVYTSSGNVSPWKGHVAVERSNNSRAPVCDRITKPPLIHRLITLQGGPSLSRIQQPSTKQTQHHNHTKQSQTVQNVRTHASKLVIRRPSRHGGPLPCGGSRNSTSPDGNVSSSPIGCAVQNPKYTSEGGRRDIMAQEQERQCAYTSYSRGAFGSEWQALLEVFILFFFSYLMV